MTNIIQLPVSGNCSDKSKSSSVDKHPCYSESAQHNYARLHLPVAPKCNMQCNYCNRKFDCSNESRPGVVSCLLSPQEALDRVTTVSDKLDNLAVVGIAGPGDPLANPDTTFETIRLLNQRYPDLMTCLSTNGLYLNRYESELADLGVNHITVTLNAINPEVGKQIYDWMRFDGVTYRGSEAAQLLISEQLKGIEKMTQRGARVKINTVYIPGINETEIPAISKLIKKMGVEIHNIMPLISKPEFDTHFSRIGQREPTHQELTRMRDDCGVDMKMMRHCRQCRADAVGLLGEDQSGCIQKLENTSKFLAANPKPHVPEETKQRPLSANIKEARIAVTSKGMGLVNQHFGKSREFLIYRVNSQTVELEGIKRIDEYCVGDCGDDYQDDVMSRAIMALDGIDYLLTARIGARPEQLLTKAGIRVTKRYAMDEIASAVRCCFNELQSSSAVSAADVSG